MSEKIEISIASKPDLEKANELYNRIYKTNRTLEQFYWEFVNAPHGPAIYIIAKDGDTIIGTQCAMPMWVLTGNGDKVLTAKSEDTLVDPAYRGKNIFEKMYQKLFEECEANGIKYIWGFTSAKKPFTKIGFEIPFSQTQSLAVFDLLNSFTFLSSLNQQNSLIDKVKIFGLCVLSRLIAIKFKITNFDKFTLKANEVLNLDDFLQTITKSNHQYFYIDQSEKYIKWRIFNNPYYSNAKTYSFYTSSGSLVAYLIFNIAANNICYLVQALYSPELDEKECVDILKCSIKELRKNNSISLIRTWNFEHVQISQTEIDFFKKSGFVYLKRGFPFVWKRLTKEDILNPNHFLLSRIATQGIN